MLSCCHASYAYYTTCHPADWDEALVGLWKKAQQEVGPLTYGQVRDQLDPGAPSCGLQVDSACGAAM